MSKHIILCAALIVALSMGVATLAQVGGGGGVINPPDLSSYATTNQANDMSTKTNWANATPDGTLGMDANAITNMAAGDSTGDSATWEQTIAGDSTPTLLGDLDFAGFSSTNQNNVDATNGTFAGTLDVTGNVTFGASVTPTNGINLSLTPQTYIDEETDNMLRTRTHINTYVVQDPTNGLCHQIECPWKDGGTFKEVRVRVAAGALTGQVDIVTAAWNAISATTTTMIESNIVVATAGVEDSSMAGTATLTNKQSFAFVLKNLSEFATTNIISITYQIEEN